WGFCWFMVVMVSRVAASRNDDSRSAWGLAAPLLLLVPFAASLLVVQAGNGLFALWFRLSGRRRLLAGSRKAMALRDAGAITFVAAVAGVLVGAATSCAPLVAGGALALFLCISLQRAAPLVSISARRGALAAIGVQATSGLVAVVTFVAMPRTGEVAAWAAAVSFLAMGAAAMIFPQLALPRAGPARMCA